MANFAPPPSAHCAGLVCIADTTPDGYANLGVQNALCHRTPALTSSQSGGSYGVPRLFIAHSATAPLAG